MCDCKLEKCPSRIGDTIRPNVPPGLPVIPPPRGGHGTVTQQDLDASPIYRALVNTHELMDVYLGKIKRIQNGISGSSPGLPIREVLDLSGVVAPMKKPERVEPKSVEPSSEIKPLTSEEEPMWSIQDALVVVREMRPEVLAHGYTMDLGGGVLQNGFSRNDLDLMVVPRLDMRPYPETTIIWLFESRQWKFLSKSDRGPLQIYHISKAGKLVDLIFVQLKR